MTNIIFGLLTLVLVLSIIIDFKPNTRPTSHRPQPTLTPTSEVEE